MEEADLPTFRRVVVQKRSYAQASIITIAVEDAGRGKIDTGPKTKTRAGSLMSATLSTCFCCCTSGCFGNRALLAHCKTS